MEFEKFQNFLYPGLGGVGGSKLNLILDDFQNCHIWGVVRHEIHFSYLSPRTIENRGVPL